MAAKPDDLKHSTLRQTLRGKPSSSTVQFRNLIYASIPGRYKDSIPNHTLRVGNDGVVDATQFGPSCPHLRGAQAWDLTLTGNAVLQCEKGQGRTEKMDEFECLNLNVTVPKSVLKDGMPGGRGLPVFVWVHGGSLSIGSNNWPQYDVRRFVERSVEINRPIIGVAINYRINIFGFLAGEDIGSDGNMGYKDQMQAFRWIKRHIAGFGGDPENVTAAGESAGGVSLSTLLCANVGEEGLFERVVVMSGEATLRKWRNRWWQEKMCEDQSAYLKLDVKDTESRKKTLLDTDAEELVQKLPLAQHFTATVDARFFTEKVTLDALLAGDSVVHKPSWCKEFVIGDTAHDGLVLKARVLDQPDTMGQFKKACAMYLSASDTHNLLAAYSLDGPAPKTEQAEHLLELATELRFYLPTLTAHRGWKACSPPRRASRYHFHVPNPVDGPYKGLASHELDVTYLLNNYHDYFDEHNRRIAEAMQDQFIRYTHGDGWVEDDKVLVFNSDGVVTVGEDRYDATYRSGRGKVLESIGMQKLWHVAEMWQNVRQEEEEPTGSHGESKL